MDPMMWCLAIVVCKDSVLMQVEYLDDTRKRVEQLAASPGHFWWHNPESGILTNLRGKKIAKNDSRHKNYPPVGTSPYPTYGRVSQKIFQAQPLKGIWYNWLVVEPTHLKNVSQNENLPQVSGWKFQKYLKPPSPDEFSAQRDPWK